VATPETIAARCATSVAAPETIAARCATSVATPETFAARRATSVATPENIAARRATSVATPQKGTARGATRGITPTIRAAKTAHARFSLAETGAPDRRGAGSPSESGFAISVPGGVARSSLNHRLRALIPSGSEIARFGIPMPKGSQDAAGVSSEDQG
jgi:hypothetical protein